MSIIIPDQRARMTKRICLMMVFSGLVALLFALLGFWLA
jgi:hypothetical protein